MLNYNDAITKVDCGKFLPIFSGVRRSPCTPREYATACVIFKLKLVRIVDTQSNILVFFFWSVGDWARLLYGQSVTHPSTSVSKD